MIDGICYGECRRWWGKISVIGDKGKPESRDIEIDLVAESLDHTTILLGECKWTTGENGRLLTHKLQKVAENLPFTKGKEIVVILFTKERPEDDLGNSLLPEDVLGLM